MNDWNRNRRILHALRFRKEMLEDRKDRYELDKKKRELEYLPEPEFDTMKLGMVYVEIEHLTELVAEFTILVERSKT